MTEVRTKSKWFLGAALGIALSAPAYAQDAAEGVEAGDIIVTARRVEESIQDVPISITVFNQEALDRNNVTTGADLATYTPNLSANQKFGVDNTTFSIRGFFQELRTTASVGVYFADVIAPRGPANTAAGDGAGPGDFFDLQNVQILKGPQGTLFGRNTTGGAVLLVPQKPKDTFGGYIEGTYGNFNERRLQGVVNLPFSETIRFRAGLDWRKRDGYLRNRSGIGPRDFASVDYIAARASLVINVTPNIENYTIGTYALSKGRGNIGHLEAAIAAVPPLGGVAAAELAREQQLGAGPFDVFNRLPNAGNELEIWRVINTTTWTASDNITLKNIISYSTLRNDVRSNLFGDFFPLGATYSFFDRTSRVFRTTSAGAFQGQFLPFARVHSLPGGNITNQATFTEEFRVQGKSFDNRLNWQAGIYYEKSTPRDWTGTFGYGQLVCEEPLERFRCTDAVSILQSQAFAEAGALGANGVLRTVRQGTNGGIELNQKKTRFENVGLYAQGTFAVTDWLDFTAGFRYTWDKTDSEFHRYNIRFPAPNTPFVLCADTSAPSGGTPTDAFNRVGCRATAAVKTSAPTWTLSVEARPVDDVMVFAKWSRGYRQGATNPDSLPGFKTFEDERVDVYELGLRASGRIGAGRAFLNLTGFYNDFKNQQVQSGAFVINTAPNAVIINAGSSRMYGLELEAGIEPVEGLNLNVSYGYLNTRLSSLTFPGTPVGPGTPGYLLPFPGFDLGGGAISNGQLVGPILFPTSQAGTDLPLSPHHTLVLGAQYTLPVPESVGDVSVGMTYAYTSEQVFSFSNFPAGRFGARNIVNANVTWKSVAGSPIDLSLFGTNLLDDTYVVLVNDQTSSGFITRNYGEPRMYGARVRYNFGGR